MFLEKYYLDFKSVCKLVYCIDTWRKMKTTNMSRRKKFLIWLAGMITLLGLSYASLPWLIAGLLKHNLSSQGLSEIQLHVDYPGWHRIRLHSLAFTAMAGENQLFCQIPEVEVAYQLTELVTGNVARIRLPVVEVRIQSDAHSISTGPGNTVLPLAALLSGQWLSQLPVHELLFEQLSVDVRVSADTVYSLRLKAQLRDAQLEASGDIRFPPLPQLPSQIPAQNPLVFSLSARHTGEARLFVSSAANAAEPLLQLVVNPVASEHEAFDYNGDKLKSIVISAMLTASLNRLAPMLVPRLTSVDWPSGLEGDLNCQWQTEVTNSNWRVTGEVEVHGLGGHWRDQLLPRAELTAKFNADPQTATLQATLRAAEQAMTLQTRGVHQFATGHGHADLKLLPVKFSDAGFELSRLLKNWPYPFDISAGRVSGSGRLVWQKAIDLHGVLKLNKLGGHFKKLAFTGLSGELALALVIGREQGLRTTKDAQLRVDVVDVGFPVEKLDVRFALAPHRKTVLPLVRIRKFSAELLGGRAQTGPFELDFGRQKNAFVVQLEGIGLNEIMKLEQQQGLQGSGMLDGQIPVEISNEGIVVTHGQLSARAPGGVIRYTPTPKVAAMAQSNQSVNIIVQALSNFHYHLLNVISDYKAGGDLALQVRLEGQNPDWQAGQPIHLNLNLDENIPVLLRSLQMSDEISERVRKRYQNTP